jgi:putative membrane protein
MLKDLRNFLNGAVYGITLIIPGVSATILAVILGFYDELIYTVNHFRENYRKNARYLGAFFLGIAAGSVIFSSIVIFLLENFSFPVMLFFIGLLAGIIPFVFSKAKGTNPGIATRKIVLAILSLLVLPALSFGITTENPAASTDTMNIALVPYIFLAGIINGATLVIPGLSGALILLVMGLYPPVISSISFIGIYIGDLGNFSLLRDISLVLLPFGMGALIGCLGMARLMEKLMRNYPKAVYAAILGLLLGSVTTLLYEQLVNVRDTSIAFLIAGVVMFLIGGVTAFILGKKQ